MLAFDVLENEGIMDEAMNINTIYYIPSRKSRLLNLTVRLTMWLLRETVVYYPYRSIKYGLKYSDVDDAEDGGRFVCCQIDGTLISRRAKMLSNDGILSEMLDAIDKKNDEIARQTLWDNYLDILPGDYFKNILKKIAEKREAGARYSVNTDSKRLSVNIDDFIDMPEPKEMPKPVVEPPPMTLLSKETLDAKEAKRVAEELKAVIEERIKAAGVKALSEILNPEFLKTVMPATGDRLSKIVVGGDGKITLPDYNVVLSMPPLSKALYILFLRHPEGIILKTLDGYKKELREIYNNLSNRIDMSSLGTSIDEMCNPENNSINEKLSRIKKAFLSQLPEKIAMEYIPTGERGEAKNIRIDRSMVEIKIFP